MRRQDGTIIVVGNSNLAAGPIVNYTARARLEKRLQVDRKLKDFLERKLQPDCESLRVSRRGLPRARDGTSGWH